MKNILSLSIYKAGLFRTIRFGIILFSAMVFSACSKELVEEPKSLALVTLGNIVTFTAVGETRFERLVFAWELQIIRFANNAIRQREICFIITSF